MVVRPLTSQEDECIAVCRITLLCSCKIMGHNATNMGIGHEYHWTSGERLPRLIVLCHKKIFIGRYIGILIIIIISNFYPYTRSVFRSAYCKLKVSREKTLDCVNHRCAPSMFYYKYLVTYSFSLIFLVSTYLCLFYFYTTITISIPMLRHHVLREDTIFLICVLHINWIWFESDRIYWLL